MRPRCAASERWSPPRGRRPRTARCRGAATGNIAIFAGCDRPTFDRILPLLATMGRHILHTGPLGSATVLKVVTNYIFGEAQGRYGPREWSPNVVRRLEERTGLDIRAPGFPAELHDDGPEEPGSKVHPKHL